MKGVIQILVLGRSIVQAVRLFSTLKPIVAAVQGPAIGGGLGLWPRRRLQDRRTRSAPLRRTSWKIGIHPGFWPHPHVAASDWRGRPPRTCFYTGRRVDGPGAGSRWAWPTSWSHWKICGPGPSGSRMSSPAKRPAPPFRRRGRTLRANLRGGGQDPIRLGTRRTGPVVRKPRIFAKASAPSKSVAPAIGTAA